MRIALPFVLAFIACGGKTAVAPDADKPSAPDADKPSAPDTEKPPAPDIDKPSAPDSTAPKAGDTTAGDTTPTDSDEPPPPAWMMVPPAAVPAPTATTGACVADMGETWRGFIMPGVDGRNVTFCRHRDPDATAHDCWKLDLDSGKLATTKTTPEMKLWGVPRVRPPKEIKLSKNDTVAKVCADTCVPVDLKGMIVEQAGYAAGRAFIAPGSFVEQPTEAPRTLRMFDAKTGAELWSKRFEALESSCPMFTLVGDVLYAQLGVCAGPGASGVFFDAQTGNKLGVLGGAADSASAYAVNPVLLPWGAVAFREQYGYAIFVHDGKTGAIVSRMNLTGTITKDAEGNLSTMPEEGFMVGVARADGGLDLVVGQGGPDRKKLVVVDAATLKITKLYELQPCP